MHKSNVLYKFFKDSFRVTLSKFFPTEISPNTKIVSLEILLFPDILISLIISPKDVDIRRNVNAKNFNKNLIIKYCVIYLMYSFLNLHNLLNDKYLQCFWALFSYIL